MDQENFTIDNACDEFRLPTYAEIPNVGLFLEQVSKYVNEILSPLGEPGLTGSMISNYVKKGILNNPVKKQYGRDQVAYLIYIALAKNVLSLDDVASMIRLQQDACDTETAYEYFRAEFPTVLKAVFKESELPESGHDSLIKRLSRNVSITIAHKIYLDLTFAGMK